MNFSLVLLLLTVGTGVIWALDRFLWRPKRLARAKQEADRFSELNREAIDQGQMSVIGEAQSIFNKLSAQPKWIEYTGGFFPVILFVFLLRSFVVEPFRIPSGSMLPTLYIGDFILVNKYDYGIRLPVINTKIISIGEPERGDVVVFRYPMDESMDYIKRVIGVPGDTVEYVNKQIRVNGQTIEQKLVGDWVDPFSMVTLAARNSPAKFPPEMRMVAGVSYVLATVAWAA